MGEPDVTLVDTIGSLRGGHGESEFNNPSALASDYHGNLVVADTNNHRVVKLDAKGAFLWSLGGSDADGLPRPGTAQGEFFSPQAVCTDTDNNIYVADSRNCRVQKLSPSGDVVTVFGSWGNETGQLGGEGPLGIAVDENGFILVSDSHTAGGGNHKVQKFDPDGRYVGHFGGYGTGPSQFAGAMPIREYGFDFGPGIGPGPIGPAGIVVDTDEARLLEKNNLGGDVYVADCDNDRVVNFRQGTGAMGRSLGLGTLYRPRQLAMDGHARVYVSGVHKHDPPMAVHDINDPFNWRIEPECRWVSVLDASGGVTARVGTAEAHDMLEHRPGTGLHSHGYGLAISRADDSVVYVQGSNLIFKFNVVWNSSG